MMMWLARQKPLSKKASHVIVENNAASNSVINSCRCWIERVVIGFNLCPFARKPYAAEQIRYAVSSAKTPAALLIDLQQELEALRQSKSEQNETTVLIHPYVLQDFFDYNDFLGIADMFLEQNGYADEFQIASLHPDYQFVDTEKEDAENYTNRSPYPMLHLLREQSVENALCNTRNPELIPEQNIKTMEKIGAATMQKILDECTK